MWRLVTRQGVENHDQIYTERDTFRPMNRKSPTTPDSRSSDENLSPYHGWFGESWGAPINSIQPRFETPVDENCFFCREPILATDQGYVMPFDDETEGLKRVAVHKRCQHRALGLKG